MVKKLFLNFATIGLAYLTLHFYCFIYQPPGLKNVFACDIVNFFSERKIYLKNW